MNKGLISCILFKDISEEEIENIFTGIFYQVKEYKPDTIVMYQDDEIENFMILLEGVVRGEMIDFSGKTIVIEVIGSSNLLAPAFVFGKNNKSPVNIVTQSKAKILKIPKAEFVKMMQKNNILLTNFINSISDRAQFLSQKLKFLSFNSIKGKFAYYLLSISKEQNTKKLTIPISQEKLADLFGITRPSLGRVIRELNNEDIIYSNGKNIEIIDEEKLSELIK